MDMTMSLHWQPLQILPVSLESRAYIPEYDQTGCGSTAGAGPGTTRPLMVSIAAAMPSAVRMSCCSSVGDRSAGSTPGGRSIRIESSASGAGAGAGVLPAAALPCKPKAGTHPDAGMKIG